MSLSLTFVKSEDEPFLFEVYASSRAYEMSLVPWDETQKIAFLKIQFAAQLNHYQTFYTNAQHKIIRLKDEPVGRIYTADLKDEIRILDITILHTYRNQGIGTKLIRSIMNQGEKAGKPVCIYVETFNPSQRLFKRLGFSKVSEDGVNILFAWNSKALTNVEVKSASSKA